MMSARTAPAITRHEDDTAARVVRIQSGGPVLPLSVSSVPDPDIFSDVITRVEWDALVKSGRDPFHWYGRLPRYQRLMAMGVVADGARFRVSSNLTVIY